MTTHLSKEVYEKLVGKSTDIKTNKYHNKKIYYDGHWFDSEKEKSYYIKFKLMQNTGEIHNLTLQVEFELQPVFKLKNKMYRSINYLADFTYYDKDNNYHIIDIKGYKTEVYKIKKKLMAYKYDIEIEEI